MSFLQLLMAGGSMATLAEEEIKVGNFHAVFEFFFTFWWWIHLPWILTGLCLISERQFKHKTLTVRLIFSWIVIGMSLLDLSGHFQKKSPRC